jgi:uncharacterized transporter YbjL
MNKRRFQFSLLALLLAFTLASTCLAVGVRLSSQQLLCALFAPIMVTILISAASLADKRKRLTCTLSMFALCIGNGSAGLECCLRPYPKRK